MQDAIQLAWSGWEHDVKIEVIVNGTMSYTCHTHVLQFPSDPCVFVFKIKASLLSDHGQTCSYTLAYGGPWQILPFKASAAECEQRHAEPQRAGLGTRTRLRLRKTPEATSRLTPSRCCPHRTPSAHMYTPTPPVAMLIGP